MTSDGMTTRHVFLVFLVMRRIDLYQHHKKEKHGDIW